MSEKLRIVHLIKTTGIAGAETHLLALLPALRERGVDSRVILLQDPARPARDFLDRLGAAAIPAATVPLRWHLDPAVPGRLHRALAAAPIDVLHAHLPHGEMYGALAAHTLPGKPFVISRHNDDRFRRAWLARLVFAPSLRRADAVIAISGAVRRFLIEIEHADAGKVVCIPYGLDADAYAARTTGAALGARGEDERRVVFIGRLTAQKGVDLLLRAFARVEKHGSHAKLFVVGDGPDREELIQLAGSLALRRVEFLGWRTDTPAILQDADMLVMASRWEGFGMVALEAMAMGKPVIAPAVSALPEIVSQGRTGLLVPPEDPVALAAAILDLSGDPVRAAAFGEAGRIRCKREFGLDRMADRTAEVYRRLLTTGE